MIIYIFNTRFIGDMDIKTDIFKSEISIKYQSIKSVSPIIMAF
jgi:hypothetical protein